MTKFRWSSPPGESDPARVQRDSSPVVLSDTATARVRNAAKKKRKKKAKEVADSRKMGTIKRAAALEKEAAERAARKGEAAFQKAVARRKAAAMRAQSSAEDIQARARTTAPSKVDRVEIKRPPPSSEAQLAKLDKLARKRIREGSSLDGVAVEKRKLPRRPA